ncbi:MULTISPECIES: ATP synthase subunit I [Propionispora]|uniref:ATP synthase I chain n=2 Tax=Propionispora TaxID=112902 RepID=A0A1H8PU85_9FIRM|nr:MULTISPECIES: ATP synthase subunit I [Propionispora]SEO45247.1 ATP synthase I chain [Propionispora vibrioides]SHI51127.1 ATP synthase I chain [Propionispora hippei DSM 15287]
MLNYFSEVKCVFLALAAAGGLAYAMLLIWGKPALANGLLAGLLISAVYFLMMCFRIRKTAELPLRSALLHMRQGWLLRLIFIACSAFLAMQIPALDILGVIAGLFLLHVVVFLHAVRLAVRDGKSVCTKDNRKG